MSWMVLYLLFNIYIICLFIFLPELRVESVTTTPTSCNKDGTNDDKAEDGTVTATVAGGVERYMYHFLYVFKAVCFFLEPKQIFMGIF